MARQANCFAPLRESPFIIESISRKPYDKLLCELERCFMGTTCRQFTNEFMRESVYRDLSRSYRPRFFAVHIGDLLESSRPSWITNDSKDSRCSRSDS